MVNGNINNNHGATSAFSQYKKNHTCISHNDEMREYNITHGNSIQVGKHSYLLCIPDLPPSTTKVQVARAVESRILFMHYYTGQYKYVKNVVFVEGFDEESKNAIENSCYKIAIVNIEMPPSDDGTYTEYENEFYDGICRGDIFIGEWSNAFLMANPNYYFKMTAAADEEEAAAAAAAQVKAAQTELAFQKWKHNIDIESYKSRVKNGEEEICELQNTVNELLESLRFLSRRRSGEGLVGLKDASKSLSSFLSTLHNQYARICVSDVEFLEINKNMKLKRMVELVVNMCDDCDASQELIHSLDYVTDYGQNERRRDLFAQIEKLICRINHSVRKFQRLHLYAERCIFGLKNRVLFTEFTSFLNTAVEIVEEVTSRNCTHTEDVEYVRSYGIFPTKKTATTKATMFTSGGGSIHAPAHADNDDADGSCVGDYYGGGWDGSNGYDGVTVNNNYYDYYENADSGMDEEITSVSQMLAEFETTRAFTAPSAPAAPAPVVVLEDNTNTVDTTQVIIAANESEEVEVVIASTAEKEEQEKEETNNNGSSTNNGDNSDASKNKPKGKWFSWF